MSEQPLSKSAIQEAEEYGLDVTLLYENLRLTPTERLEQLKRMFEFEKELSRAARSTRPVKDVRS